MKPLTWDAVNPATGEPYRWDDPNLIWGDPSVILEPGDPGYTPPAPVPATHKPKNKRNTMKHQRYYPIRQGDQLPWLDNFWRKLRQLAAQLQLPAARVEGIVADARWLHYLIGTWLPAVRAFNKSATDTLAQAQFGTGGPLIMPVFTPPAMPPADGDAVPPLPAVEVRDEGALGRIFDFVGEIKENNLCTEANCTDLGILGSADTAPDLTTLRPEIAAVASGSVVKITWGWQGLSKWLDLCEIQVDRGTAQGWQPLVFDTTPNYDDTHPHPAASTQWKYRAIFRVGEQQTGEWSVPVTVLVGGS